jgi:hypothetical protein
MFNGPHRVTLRSLPLAVRVVLALFLLSVGVGYGAAMVQIHFQDARPGQFLPGLSDAVKKFHGDEAQRVSQIQRLLEADEGQPFNGSGSMAEAFTRRSDGWARAIRTGEEQVRRERQGEREAVLRWIKDGLRREAYDSDHLPPAPADQPLTAEFRHDDGGVKLKSLLTARCVRCHQKDGDDANAANFPLDTYEHIQSHAQVTGGAGAMSLNKLAQSTHAHLLSFAMLFALTGLVVALSSYPGWLRGIVAPLVLVAQLAEIACWWLARLDGPPGVMFAQLILVFGGVVGAGLFGQILLGLFDLFGMAGRAVLLMVLIAAGVVGGVVKLQVIDPHLQREAGGKAAAPGSALAPAEKSAK